VVPYRSLAGSPVLTLDRQNSADTVWHGSTTAVNQFSATPTDCERQGDAVSDASKDTVFSASRAVLLARVGHIDRRF
jgi:hypothetical protein